ncbi:hypothetical protein K443DRAFT_676233 [Laccaria amethystina LaAM-08-1]|uniref:Uncharacterized protein n=1 Tax=Laccaria amethystina LaAM-08-1 TaxID=1095629 RepID=A0A0C9XGQ2_9AGAR|nr:hypothetical protein K443DRAFT_676233 [Laccaria amethystina LaAM-08-1]
MTIRVVLVERCALADGSTRLEVDEEIDGRSCPGSPTNDEQIIVDVTGLHTQCAVQYPYHCSHHGCFSSSASMTNKLQRR